MKLLKKQIVFTFHIRKHTDYILLDKIEKSNRFSFYLLGLAKEIKRALLGKT